MKIKSILLIIISLLICYSCTELDLNPPSEASSATWYSTEQEIQMAVNDLFRDYCWPRDNDNWTDDWTARESVSPITGGTINSDWWVLENIWQNRYKAISRANTILLNLEENKAGLPQELIDKFTGNALFVRAAQYANLTHKWGDVIYFTNTLDIEEAFKQSRTEEDEVLSSVYEDFDAAIEKLPESYGSDENQLATKGAALAYKARTALYNEDWAIARDAAKACMDLGIYELYPDYGELFKSSTKNPKEVIFSIPNSSSFDEYYSHEDHGWHPPKYFVTRNAGAWNARNPSWDLLCAYLCTDGLPIDESPLYNPRNPFENRDPRLSETIAPFGEPHLGYIYQPHPDSTEVLNVNTGEYESNQDTRSVARYASYNGLAWKKGIDQDWSDDFQAQNDKILMRYADVLLMYAEAKIELNEIDQSVLNAINKVRARAYKVDYTETSQYPAVTTTNQDELRKQLRFERRMEFPVEGRRYMDIIRWDLAEKVLNNDIYGMLNVEALREKVVNEGLWFFPETPDIDKDGVADLSPMYDAGLIRRLAIRNFDATRQYLWPIPTKEIEINDNLEQNPGY
jgi:hypothetical protein